MRVTTTAAYRNFSGSVNDVHSRLNKAERLMKKLLITPLLTMREKRLTTSIWIH